VNATIPILEENRRATPGPFVQPWIGGSEYDEDRVCGTAQNPTYHYPHGKFGRQRF
jgi:hypothetical protein